MKMNGYVFGCDICLEVCPFNRFQKPLREKELIRRDSTELVESGRIRDLSAKQFKELFSDSPIERPTLDGMKRNVRAASISGNTNG
jgi:epoxyqueuosine reductase